LLLCIAVALFAALPVGLVAVHWFHVRDRWAGFLAAFGAIAWLALFVTYCRTLVESYDAWRRMRERRRLDRRGIILQRDDVEPTVHGTADA
jgi:membrane protein YdbS with pleckstrin-like domain